MNLRYSISLMCLFCFVKLSGQTAEETLTHVIQNAITNSQIKGGSVAAISKDSIIYTNAFGLADLETQRPYTTKTVQPIGSISKTLVGVSLMKAQELGLLDLDDNVNQYLPFQLVNPKFPKQAISLRHLASHTAGLNDTKHYEKAYIFESFPDDFHKNFPMGLKRRYLKRYIKKAASNQHIPLSKFLSNIYTPQGAWYSSRSYRSSAPGQKYNYSNNGAAIAALAIEKASGMSYKDFVQKHILEKAGMTSSGWLMKNYDESKKTKLHFAGYENPDFELITYTDGGFVTNVEDFASYFQNLLRGYYGEDNIIKASSYKEMMSKQFENEDGIFMSFADTNLIGHNGGDPGLATFAYFFSDKPIGAIFFMNTSETKGQVETINVVLKALLKHAAATQGIAY